MEKIRILGKEFRIGYEERLLTPNGEKASGHIDGEKLVILLEQRLASAVRGEVLLHEVLHELNSQLSLGLTEGQITQLGTGLYAVVADNPEWDPRNPENVSIEVEKTPEVERALRR